MAVLQDTVGAGIVTLLTATPFTTYIDAANYGYTFDSLKPRNALVRPMDAPPAAEFIYDDSARVQLGYDVYFQLFKRDTPEAEVAGLQDAMRKKFGEGGIALYAATTTPSTPSDLKGGGFVVELGAPVLTVSGDIAAWQDTVDPDAPVLHWPLTVHAWQSYT